MRRVDPRIDGRRVQRQQAAFADARDADRQIDVLAPIELLELIDGGLHLFDFIADDVPAHFERLPIDEFAVRLIRVRNQRAAGISVVPADERRHDDLNAVCRQPAGKRVVIFNSGRPSRRTFLASNRHPAARPHARLARRRG